MKYLRSMTLDEQFMHRCLQLAELGKPFVSPNPMVGAVIVCENKIIGEGYHQKYGGNHAEVNAINSVVDQALFPKSTIYVSLEPCSHFGNTPPCGDLIIEKKFERVVIGTRDPNKIVNGKGINSIIAAGIKIDIGILEQECRKLNKQFFTYHEKARPFITLKWAQTKNGLLDNEGKKTQISSRESITLVHKWRSEHNGILIGRKTAEVDNPELNVREYAGRNPVRILIDPDLSVSKKSKIFNVEAKTIVLNKIVDSEIKNIQRIKLSEMSLSNIVSCLYDRGIQSILVEGGATTLQYFIDENLWDQANVITSKGSFEAGTKAPSLSLSPNCSEEFFGDKIDYYMNK